MVVHGNFKRFIILGHELMGSLVSKRRYCAPFEKFTPHKKLENSENKTPGSALFAHSCPPTTQ